MTVTLPALAMKATQLQLGRTNIERFILVRQVGHRPGLALSPRVYNEKTNLMVCCPTTTQIKNYPFEVQIKSTTAAGVVLADQIKSLDWRVRKATRTGSASADELADVRAKILALIG